MKDQNWSRQIQADKEGMAAAEDVNEAPLGKKFVERNSVTIVNKSE